MTEAGSLVNLAKNITERIRSGKGGDITDDEVDDLDLNFQNIFSFGRICIWEQRFNSGYCIIICLLLDWFKL